MSDERDARANADELEKMDISDLLLDVFQGVKKLWWLVVVLALVFGLYAYFDVTTNYQPRYVASATMAVQVVGTSDIYINQKSAEQMAEVFPYILTSGVLQDVVAKDLGLDYVPGSISVSAEEGTNFFTISVSSGDAQSAYDVLQSVIENYPQVAKFVIGQTTWDILDETGVPEDTGREITIRGSYRSGAKKGALIGLGIMALYILMRKTVKSRKELKKYLNIEDYGSVPYVQEKKRRKNKKQKSLNLLHEQVPQGYLEAIRKLRIKVMKQMEIKGHKTLLVTSSVPGEGKTTLAVNLAIAIAKQGKRVVLVDSDPRNPSVAACMNESAPHLSLGDLLRSKQNPLTALEYINVGNGALAVLFGGKANDKDSKLLGTKVMRQLIEELESNADIVILDTAPSDLLADAAAMAKFVDAALYVVKYDYAKMRQVRGGIQSLSISGIDILGYVFNADKSAGRRDYGYGYSYGYKRYGNYGSYTKQGNKADDSGRVIKE